MSPIDASLNSEAHVTDPPSFLSATPEQVETGIAREIREHLPVLDARDTAVIAMVPVRPVLEAKDAEIARLRAELVTVRGDERKRIAAEFRELGMYAAANAIDPLGPLQGARAAGGTE